MIPNRGGRQAKAYEHWTRARWESQMESGISNFWSNVERGEGCWEWTGGLGSHGYGSFGFMARTWTAPRLAYWLTHGRMAPGQEVCHSCDNRLCVRPDHLSAGTHSENVRQMYERGRGGSRGRAGILNHSAKLTFGQVLEIRARKAAGERPVALADEFGVTRWHVNAICRYKARVLA